MIRAFKQAGRQPQDVDYVELHATGRVSIETSTQVLFILYIGTAKGDHTETNWVGAHFRRDDELLIGSTKANIG